MEFLLDTNICIYIIKKRSESVFNKFRKYQPGNIGISSITLAELEYGIQKSSHPEKNKNALHSFILPLEVVGFDYSAAIEYGKIRSDLEKKGTPIGSMDLLIAAHALSLGVPLVTNNVKEFDRVEHLQVLNWVE